MDKMTATEADQYGDAIADVMCWFYGFRAAKPDAEMPPNLDRLRDLKVALNRYARDFDEVTK